MNEIDEYYTIDVNKMDGEGFSPSDDFPYAYPFSDNTKEKIKERVIKDINLQRERDQSNGHIHDYSIRLNKSKT